MKFGLNGSSKPEKHRAQIDWMVRTFQIVNFDTDAAHAAGIALANHFIIVTHNTREFERVPGLRMENWLSVEPA